MKRFILFAFVALMAASCASLTRERQTDVYYSDYTAFPDMWISPNVCSMQHKVLGDLLIEIQPAIGHTNSKISTDGIYSQNRGALRFERISGDELLAMAVAEARARGANGISNFKIDVRRSDSGIVNAYIVSGLLIHVD
jgi:hypothetical protein